MNRRTIVVPLLLALTLLAGGCKSGSASSTSAPAGPQSTSSDMATPSSAAPGSAAATSANGCPTSNTTSFAKTKFVLHTGLAFGAFHRYLYKPLRAGTFTTSGAIHRVVAIAKGGAAALFIKREVRLAIEDVKANPTLCNTLAAPLTNLSDTISGAVSKLKGGDTSGLTAAEQGISSIESAATKGGAAITEDANASIG